MANTPGLGPGYGESSEQKVQAELSITERFFGTGVLGQSFALMGKPMLPMIVEQYNFKKKAWELIDEIKYTIINKTITLIATVKVLPPPNPALNSNKNVRVRYAVDTAGGIGLSDLSLEANSDVYGLITIAGPAPVTQLAVSFSPITGKGLIDRIVIVRETVAGTPYTVNSRIVEIFDTTIGPVDNGINSLFRDIGLEPDALNGRLVNRDAKKINIDFQNIAPADFGQALIQLTAAGGDGTSQEEYSFKIQGVVRS